jgi:glycosyltransferase involved in cell wall biosynthesis
VIAAFNEEERVGAVVRTVLASGHFYPVIVVDDGSTDQTSVVAEEAGASVLVMRPNGGKASAMRRGWEASGGSDVAFFDADLMGLKIEHCDALMSGYLAGYDQTCGLRDYVSISNPLQVFTPILTGERIVRGWVLKAVPWDCWSGFNIETAINEIIDKFGGKTCVFILKGLVNTVKEKKRGLVAGLKQNYAMFTKLRKAKFVLRQSGGTSCKIEH